MNRPAGSSRGFTITEMLVILGLLGVAGLLASRLFAASMRVVGSAPAQQDRQVNVDRMMQVLRQDVWASRRIEVTAGNSVQLDSATWRIGDKAITRISNGGERWWSNPGAVQFHRDGSSLVIDISTGKYEPPDAWRLASQLLQDQEAKR